MSSQSQEGIHRIQSRELASHIGWAEYPHLAMATTALAVGLQEDYVKYVANAEAAGIEAGRRYMDSIAKDLASYAFVSQTLGGDHERPVAETLPVHQENYPGVRITKDDLVRFAEQQNVAGSSDKVNAGGRHVNPNANTVSQVWVSLARLADDIHHRDYYPDRVWYYRRTPPLLELRLDIKNIQELYSLETYHDAKKLSRNLLDVSMDTLVNLISEFDRVQDLYPSKTTGEILGTGFGDTKLDFLRNFVEYKKAQLARESTE